MVSNIPYMARFMVSKITYIVRFMACNIPYMVGNMEGKGTYMSSIIIKHRSICRENSLKCSKKLNFRVPSIIFLWFPSSLVIPGWGTAVVKLLN